MDSQDRSTRYRPIAVAPASSSGGRGLPETGSERHTPMPHTCQNCAKRKVKCDKATPTCFSCRRAKLECVYKMPLPRTRRKKLSDDSADKIARYERILSDHGLLDSAVATSSGGREDGSPVSLHWHEPLASGPGRLLTGEGRSRYIHGSLWHPFEDDDVQRESDFEEDGSGHGDDERDGAAMGAPDWLAPDPVTAAFMGFRQNLLPYHPSHRDGMLLWRIHSENVEPLCKILHIPSTADMVHRVTLDPATASRTEECQLFAIYHFAVYSMTEDDCSKSLGKPRALLMETYNYAARQALVNASFLRTTELSVLQALVLLLISCRFRYDAQTFWVLTGVAIRIAQRIGLHREGQKLGLPPFQVQMRRRLLYQLISLEGSAAQVAGSGITQGPDSWDAETPLNVNDEDIWPEMTDTPNERGGATDMMFCLARISIAKLLIRGASAAKGNSSRFRDFDEAESFINEAEREMEERFIRHCDVINPIHFLTMALVRAGIVSMRLRIRLQRVRSKAATVEERKDAFELAMRILDTNVAIHSHAGLERFHWHIRALSLFGTWESLIFSTTTILRDDRPLSTEDVNRAWSRIEKIYTNHDVATDSKRGLYQAFRRLTLKAWEARPATGGEPQPSFISEIREREEPRRPKWSEERDAPVPMQSDDNLMTGADAFPESLPGILGLESSGDVGFDPGDWEFWQQLIHEQEP